ncbi:alginate lyase family protein [Carboxylicivirga sp. N1Y90]|uniref:alginate lyase family protein n=1 Tax=Carboxylicivirga fragile TaxID=3417571 RepID=UPI003D32941F|nr:alginate lyase family protein [Marinilabiliaceae bacterium N1Y90]
MRILNYIVILVFVLSASCSSPKNKKHQPSLILTAGAVDQIKSELNNLPILQRSVSKLTHEVNEDMKLGVNVPVPKDPAGGYTHNRHKQNYITMKGAGVLWQLTGELRYKDYVRDMLVAYAEMYPSLGFHPVQKSYAPGKLFWQSLNEAVWLVYTSQAYDCISGDLLEEERTLIESQLLIPFANFLSIETPKVFNRVHNHGVWAAAAVGMTGFAINNNEMVEHAYYGVSTGPKDEKVGAGFFTQLDQLFSPDGYYTEGPYYQRYALLPYMLFAQAIDNNQPELNIFEYREGILKKAVLATLQLTSTDGRFFPFNDALKSMSYMATELVHAVDIVYAVDPSNKELLSIAQEQDEVIICDAGLDVAKAINNNEAKAFKWQSLEFSDGPKGDQGAVGVLRSGSGKDEQCVIMKYASQGMGHGHFDRLTIQLYDGANEILQDYGAARYVNVEYKHGGRYLPENKTWAKQTIAHNTLVVDNNTQFDTNLKKATKTSSEPWIFNGDDVKLQVMSAKELNAYSGVEMQRTLALIQDEEEIEHSVVVDVIKVAASENHDYDLPYHYLGQFMDSNLDYKAEVDVKKALGQDNGYQHLWLDGEASATEDQSKVVWLNNGRFYTLISETKEGDQVLYTRLGANDPEFSLRNEPSVILRRKNTPSTTFSAAIEVHGSKHPVTEIVENLKSNLVKVTTVYDTKDYTAVQLDFNSGHKKVFVICNQDNSMEGQHEIQCGDQQYKWQGAYALF